MKQLTLQRMHTKVRNFDEDTVSIFFPLLNCQLRSSKLPDSNVAYMIGPCKKQNFPLGNVLIIVFLITTIP